MLLDEGYVKYRAEWERSVAPPDILIHDINDIRSRLWAMNLIGAYTEGEYAGIGFGNISVRAPKGEGHFIISGTQTGHIQPLTAEHYTSVMEYSIGGNWLRCRGPIQASSESLTHAAVYECDPRCQVVIHVHHLGWWQKLLGRIPTSPEDVPYGTPAMSDAVKHLYQTSDLPSLKAFAMGGHTEGIITFGDSPQEAFDRILWLRKLVENTDLTAV